MRTEKKHKKDRTIELLVLITLVIIIVVSCYTYFMGMKLNRQAIFAVKQNAKDIAVSVSSALGFVKGDISFSTGLAQQGVKGKTQIEVIYGNDQSTETQVNFFTPFYYEGNIVGEISGSLGADTDIAPLLERRFLAQKLMGFLCNHEGKVIASTEDGVEPGMLVDEYLADAMGLSVKLQPLIKEYDKTKTDLSMESTLFRCREKSGNAIGCVTGITGTDWYIVQIAPAEVLLFLKRETIIQAYMISVFSFALFMLCLFVVTKKQKRKSEKEIADSHGVIEVLSKEYKSVYLIDTETENVIPYRLSEHISQRYEAALMKGLPWEEGIQGYCNLFVKEEYKEEFLKKCSLNNLKQQLQKEGDYFYYEYMNDKVGQQHVFRIVASLLPDSDKKQIVLGFADINEEREKELALQRTLQDACNRAEAANKAKSTFLFNISHDIRTPMNAIIGFTDLALRYKDDVERLEGYLNKMKSASEYMMKLLNGVLEMARIETGKITLDLAPVELTKVINGAFSLFEEEAKRKNLFYHCDIGFKSVYGNLDSIRVQEIFSNIISNAIKYTCENGCINVSANLLEKSEEEAAFEFVVKDNGIGMSKEFQKRIFDNFERERNEHTTEIQGTGLGMGITKQLVEIMGGTIEVESELGKGTTVKVQIPFEIVKMLNTRWDEVKEDTYSKYYKGKRILLAEDNELNAEIAMELIKGEELEVERAHDGVECISMLMKAPDDYYDLILMDIQMPYLDGYMTTRKIRNLENQVKAEIPIIAMSANAFEEDRKRALEAGMNGFSPKPIEVEKLLETIAEVFVFR